MKGMMEKIKNFINSTTGIVASIAVLAVFVLAVWGFIFLSSSQKTEETRIPTVKEAPATDPATPSNPQAQPKTTPTTAVSVAKKGDGKPILSELDLFQLKDPFRALVSEEAATPAATETSGTESTVTTGTPLP